MTRDEKSVGDKVPVTASLLAGALSGACAKTVIAPFCRLRMNFQISSNQVFSIKAAIDYLKVTHQQRGLSHLFRGNSITVVRCMPFSAIQWASFEQFKHRLEVDKDGVETPFKRFLVGVLAGMTSTCLTYPLDVVNVRLATNPNYKNFLSVLTEGFRLRGLRSFYRGLSPTLAGAVPYSGTSFYIQSTLKLEYQKYFGEKPGPLLQLLFGAVSGVFGMSLAYPFDTVRRRMQTGKVPEAYGVVKTLKIILRDEGLVHGLYKGIRVNFLTVPVSSAIYFFSYDVFLAKIRQLAEL